jgi:hypothetical protein
VTQTIGQKRKGRPPGTLNKRTQAIADAVAATGLTPLEVIIEAMNMARNAGEMKDAATYANMAAPYIHPRLSAVTATTQMQGSMQITLIDEFRQE